MKSITKHLIKFGVAAILLTALFRIGLSYGIEHQSISIVSIFAIGYGLTMFLSGLYFGKKEGEELPIYDVGFRFHLVTFLVHNGITELWFMLGMQSNSESIVYVRWSTAIWAFILLIHTGFYLWTRKNTIQNLDKKDLFE